MKTEIYSLVCIFVLSLSVNATANVTFVDGGTSLQGILDDITVGGSSSVDVTADALSDTMDSYWSVTAAGGSLSTLVIELAEFAEQNKFGIYDMADPSKKVELFNGAASSGAMTLLSIREDFSIYVNFADTGVDFAVNAFGYYLDSSHSENGGIWYSDTSKNSDELDHLAVYQGTGTDTVKIDGFAAGLWTSNEYILAFEDFKADAPSPVPDYDDFVVMVESVNPVPEPATIALLGLGGLALRRRSRKNIKLMAH